MKYRGPIKTDYREYNAQILIAQGYTPLGVHSKNGLKHIARIFPKKRGYDIQVVYSAEGTEQIFIRQNPDLKDLLTKRNQ